jgi:anti-anti-sigma factor
MQPNEIAITTEDGIIVARVATAHLDEQQAQALLQQLLAAVAQSPAVPVLLNLTQVTTMPSMAIGALVTLWKKLQDSHQRFVLVGLQGPVRQTLSVCRLDKLFEFCDGEEEAMKRLHPPGQ